MFNKTDTTMSKLIISAIVPGTVAKLAPEDKYMLGAAIIPNPYGKTLLLIGIEPTGGPESQNSQEDFS